MMKTLLVWTSSTFLLLFVLVSNIHAHDNKHAVDAHAEQGAATSSGKQMALANIDLPDGLSLLNQFGDKVDLREEVIGDKIVVIDFVYTSCTTVCPVVSSILSIVQKQFGERMGKDVALISITVDSTRDTPHRLLSYSDNFNLGNGWSWLTGDKKNVDKALNAFGAFTPNFTDHPAMLLIGDESNSKWYRYFGFPSPAVIGKQVKMLLDNRAS